MNKTRLLQATSLLLLPVVIAYFHFSTVVAITAILLILIWIWLSNLASMVRAEAGPELILLSISASHFVEKVRWCLDLLGVDYREQPSAGTLGAFFGGRTVPVLRFRSGLVFSSIGNSSEILRYLWGRYSSERPGTAEFLKADTDRLSLEQKIDRYGAFLQVWVYFHILNDKQLTLHAWGIHNPAIPLVQRLLLRPLFPLLRFMIRKSFRITPANYDKAVVYIDRFLAEQEYNLSDGRTSLLGGEAFNFSDISFAAISGLWMQPDKYGGGKADHVKFAFADTPENLQRDVELWRTRFPLCWQFVHRLYDQNRK